MEKVDEIMVLNNYSDRNKGIIDLFPQFIKLSIITKISSIDLTTRYWQICKKIDFTE